MGMQQVNVEGLFNALKTKGKAKLSDFAEPIDLTKGQTPCEKTEQKSNINNQTSTTMANEKNAQEYVGKVIVVGDNMATIEIKGVQDNGMLSGEFRKGDAAPIMMPVTIPNLEAMMKRGVWKFQDDTKAESAGVQTTPTEDCSIKTQSPNSGGETDTDDVEEVQDVVPPTPKPKAETKEEKTEKPKGKAKEVKMGTQKSQKSQKESAAKAETKTEAESAADQTTPDPSYSGGETESVGKYVYETYTSSKGKTCARIKGFGEKDEAYVNATELHGSASWMNTKHGKVLYLSFGHKYVEKAKALCEALNAGKTLADCKAIIDGEGAKGSGTSAPKTYTLEEVAAKLKKLLPEGDKASVEDIKKLLEAA